jgi:hypothetical protein
LAIGRWGHAAVRLADGRVLVVGGNSPGTPDASGTQHNNPTVHAEVWDPATGRFGPAGDLPRPLAPVAAWLEADGRVRVVGQTFAQERGSTGPWLAMLWDPTTMAFVEAAATGEHMPGVALGNGRRLLADGLTALVWDPSSGVLSPFTSLPQSATKSVLPDGRLLIAGGTGGVEVDHGQDQGLGCGSEATLWDPITGQSTSTGPLRVARGQHAAAVLPDGRVLVTGNYWTCDEPSSAEIFSLE